MVSISTLWLPILLSGVLVFVMSSLIHMVLKYHNSDFAQLPNEGKILEAMRPFQIPAGEYHLPHCKDMKEMGTPEFKAKLDAGPVGFMTIMPNGPVSMGPSLALWFVYSLVIGVFAAYIAGRALGPGAAYLDVFRFAGTAAFLAYAVGGWQNSIWYKRSWMTTAKNTFDGLIYALVTAGAFAWLWPS